MLAVLFGALVALVVAFSARQPADEVVVLPSADGHVGMVVVERDGKRHVLNEAYATSRQGQSEVFRLSAEQVRETFASTLQSLPARPALFRLYFISGTDELTDESRVELRKVLDELKQRPIPDIAVVGHTDTVGDLEGNDRSSDCSAAPANARTSLPSAATIAPGAADPRPASSAFRRAAPYSSPCGFIASVMPSVTTQSRSPGAIALWALGYSKPSITHSGGPPACSTTSGAAPGTRASGGSWPALQKARAPVRVSRMPANAVTNSDSGFSRLISALACIRIAPGSRLSERRATLFRSDFDSAMNRLAGRPLPETSATTKNRRCRSSMKQS